MHERPDLRYRLLLGRIEGNDDGANDAQEAANPAKERQGFLRCDAAISLACVSSRWEACRSTLRMK